MIYFIICLAAFILMECIAWLAHKYIMHGLLWNLHEDHHVASHKKIQKNDLFFLVFALPGIALIYSGVDQHNLVFLSAGTGITLYGFCYFLIHDIFIHQRVKLFRNTRNPYLLALRRAHKIHHKHLDREKGECFGMLWVPIKYFRHE